IADALCHISWRAARGTANDAGLADDGSLRADFENGVPRDLKPRIDAKDALTRSKAAANRLWSALGILGRHTHGSQANRLGEKRRFRLVLPHSHGHGYSNCPDLRNSSRCHLATYSQPEWSSLRFVR